MHDEFNTAPRSGEHSCDDDFAKDAHFPSSYQPLLANTYPPEESEGKAAMFSILVA
jgi:hypothetical protein